MWKILFKVNEIQCKIKIDEFVFRVVRDGRTTNAWSNKWLNPYIRFDTYCSLLSHEMQGWRVSDLVDSGGH